MPEGEGFIGYRYKGRYFRTAIHDPRPDPAGDMFAAQIPRDPNAREVWIRATCEMIEEEVTWRREHDIPDFLWEEREEEEEDYRIVSTTHLNNLDQLCSNYGKLWEETIHFLFEHADNDPNECRIIFKGFKDRPLHFMDIFEDRWGEMPKDKESWTYVIDLDNRAFTIDGRLHFALDNMPAGSLEQYISDDEDPNWDDPCYFPNMAHLANTPIEHIATVVRWAPPPFDVILTSQEYAEMRVKTLEPNEWGIPDWTELSVAQQLSAKLTQALLMDRAERMSNPDMNYHNLDFMKCRRYVLNAAAPANLCCPPNLPVDDREQGVFTNWSEHYYDLDIQSYYPDVIDTREYHCFRGCLVLFCPRLDVPEHVQYETINIVNRLRSSGQTTGIGLVFSGPHVLAVSMHNNEVHRSEPMALYDAKMKLLDGFLLMTHLLSPFLSVNKTPWRCVAVEKPIISTPNLPTELVQIIMFQLDDDSYQKLPLVSRLFRAVYARYPRVLKFHLLEYVGDENYRVFSIERQRTETLRLRRREHHEKTDPPFNRTFHYISWAPSNLRLHPTQNFRGIVSAEHSERVVGIPQELYEAHQRGLRPALRIAVVQGIWSFVETQPAISNFRPR